jgi:hypothetical protein
MVSAGSVAVNSFWLSPSCERIDCLHHYEPAQKITGELDANTARETLMRKGFLRCVVSEGELYYERRAVPTEKQLSELRNIAIEEGLGLYDDQGREVIGKRLTEASVQSGA